MKRDENTTPALFDHCCNVYREMFHQADLKDLDGESQGLVYEGFLTQLITEKCNLSTPYYTSVTAALKKMGCVRQLRRGGSSTMSQWLLLNEPTLALYNEAVAGKDLTNRYAKQEDVDALHQRINDLNNRIYKLESMLRGTQ